MTQNENTSQTGKEVNQTSSFTFDQLRKNILEDLGNGTLVSDDEETDNETIEENKDQESEKNEDTESATEVTSEDKEDAEQEYEIKGVNGVKRVKLDELKALAQMGDDYQRVKQERDSLRKSSGIDELDKFAERSGFKNGREYLNFLFKQERQAKVDTEAQRLMDEGVPVEAAQKQAELKVRNDELEADLSERKKAESESTSKKEQIKSAFEEIKKRFGDDVEIPKEVNDKIAEGENPLQAFIDHKMELQRLQIEVLKKDLENSKSNLGSMKGNVKVKPKSDMSEEDQAISDYILKKFSK